MTGLRNHGSAAWTTLIAVCVVIFTFGAAIAYVQWSTSLRNREAVTRIAFPLATDRDNLTIDLKFALPPGNYFASLFVPVSALSTGATEFRCNVSWQLRTKEGVIFEKSEELSINADDLSQRAWGSEDLRSTYAESPSRFRRDPERPTGFGGWPMLKWPWDALAHHTTPGVLLPLKPMIVVKKPDVEYSIHVTLVLNQPVASEPGQLEFRIDPYHDI